MPISISVVLPSFNEELNLERCVNEVRNALVACGASPWEIILVNDGSSDKTQLIAEKISSNDPNVKVVSHKQNMGYGEALLSGIRTSKFQWIFITDSDLQFHPSDIDKLIPLTVSATFIQGIRSKRSDPLIRVLMGKVYKKLVHMLFKVPVTDPECSFRLINTKLLTNLEIESRGAIVPLELVLKAAAKGAVFKEVLVQHRLRQFGESNAVTFKTFFKLFKELILLFIYSKKINVNSENIQKV